MMFYTALFFFKQILEVEQPIVPWTCVKITVLILIDRTVDISTTIAIYQDKDK